MHEQLFASFMLDEKSNLEIALKAESVKEATPLNPAIQPLPASIDFLEGVMPLRGDVIPVINMKKRFGLENHHYSPDAKVAIVNLFDQQVGLIFDDIEEVFRAEADQIMPVNRLLQSHDRIISALIKRGKGKRTAEVLELSQLFGDVAFDADQSLPQAAPVAAKNTTYSRWVIFSCAGQSYGVSVEYSREIAFFSEIDDMFKSGNVEGAITLRGSTIPVMDGRFLLAKEQAMISETAENRVLILASDECSFGMVVDEIHTILTVADDEILPVPSGGSDNLIGIYSQQKGRDILLLDMANLVCHQIGELKSMMRINNGKNKEQTSQQATARSHHLITENCYLVFSVNKHFAIELKDVQEIIESENIMKVPRAEGYSTAVINLRGKIVPVINLRHFYNYPPGNGDATKLIICKGQSRTVALEVDQIITIYKQEEYHSTPSLNPHLAEKRDTLDRLIEYEKGNGMKEHVLVINMHNLVRNHLEFRAENDDRPSTENFESETIAS